MGKTKNRCGVVHLMRLSKITEVKDIIVVLPYYIAGVEDNETM